MINRLLALLAAAGVMAGASPPPPRLHGGMAIDNPAPPQALGPMDAAETIIQKWPKATRAASRAMIARYGRPTEVGSDALVWFNNGPWKKTVVHRAYASRRAAGGGDFLEQTITYEIPIRRLNDVSRVSASLRADPTRRELSARSDSESLNFLALNLADEVARGVRSPADARDFSWKTARLLESGKSSRYLNGLLFAARNEREISP